MTIRSHLTLRTQPEIDRQIACEGFVYKCGLW